MRENSRSGVVSCPLFRYPGTCSHVSFVEDCETLLSLDVCHTFFHWTVDNEGSIGLTTPVHHLTLVRLESIKEILDEWKGICHPRGSVPSNEADVHSGGLDSAGSRQEEVAALRDHPNKEFEDKKHGV